MSKAKQQLHHGEPLMAGIVRLLRERLTHIDDLSNRGALGSMTDDQVHELRKASKSSRALWRLLRESVGELAFKQFDQRIADTARRFASSRERAVRQVRFGQLLEGSTLDRSTIDHVKNLLALLDARTLPGCEAATPLVSEVSFRRLPASAVSEHPLLDALPELRTRTRGQRKTLVRALKRQYGRGRRTFERCRLAPDDAERWHDFRKLVKYHANQLAALQSSTSLERRRKRLDQLAETLGAHHDFAGLEHHLRDAASALPTTASLDPLFELLGAQHRGLTKRALKLARSLFKRSPRRAAKWWVKHSDSLR